MSMRTSGTAEEVDQGADEQAMHGLGALAASLLGERLEVELGGTAGVGHASATAASPPSELTSATPRWRSW